MMTTVTLPVYLIFLANAALLVATTFAMFRFDRLLRASRRSSGKGDRIDVEARRGDSASANHVQLVATLAALQRSVNELQQRASPPAQGQVIDLSLEHAVRMAKRGAGAEELSDECGLNEGEAELLCRLHGPRRNQKPVAQALAARTSVAKPSIAKEA